MNAPKVDVLALLDAYIAHGIPQERPDLQRARAAVAELIEAVRDGMDMPKKEGSDQIGRFYNAKNAARLRAALARIGGATS